MSTPKGSTWRQYATGRVIKITDDSGERVAYEVISVVIGNGKKTGTIKRMTLDKEYGRLT